MERGQIASLSLLYIGRPHSACWVSGISAGVGRQVPIARSWRSF